MGFARVKRRYFAGVLFWLWARALAAQPVADAIYAYTDEEGRLIHVQRFTDIPEKLREHARRVDQPEQAPAASDGVSDALLDWAERAMGSKADKPLPLYQYRGPNGRTVYTNIADSVPSTQRANARVDLDTISLNGALAGDLDRELAKRHRALQASAVCTQLRAAEVEPWWARTWREHQPLVVCGGALLLLVLLTPFMLSKGWGAAWARVLTTAMPVLGFVGVSAFLLMQSEKASSALHTRAQRCETSALQNAGDVRQRLALVTSLQREQDALAQIHAESR